METLDTKIIVALIAVLASFLGLIISKEHTISEFRQKWIDEIRDDIASLIGNLTQYHISWMIQDKKAKKITFLAENTSLINDTFGLLRRIQLRLNPIKDKSLIDKLLEIEKVMVSPEKLDEDECFQKLTDGLLSQSHEMLKTEWDKVKSGEPIFYIFKWFFSFVLVIFIVYIAYTSMSTVIHTNKAIKHTETSHVKNISTKKNVLVQKTTK